MTRTDMIKSPGKIHLKFIPSRARYYIKCPYFLYLSNTRNIHIPYSRIASRKGNLFEEVVDRRVSEEAGCGIKKALRVIDLLQAEGLYTLNRKVDTEFYSWNNIGLRVKMLKPDLILSERSESGIGITVLEIKNCDCMMSYHYLQAYVYKLTLEKFLTQETGEPVRVGARMIHLKKGCFPRYESGDDFETFAERISGMKSDYLVIRDFVDGESELVLQRTLREIASLQANTTECDTCPGAEKCDRS